MAFDPQYWANIAAMVSAMADVINLGVPFGRALARRSRDPRTMRDGQLLASAFSTYDDDEVRAIEKRIQNCRNRFIAEGSGGQRSTCLCSVLNDVKEGNGGHIPVEDWARAYEQLGCKSL